MTTVSTTAAIWLVWATRTEGHHTRNYVVGWCASESAALAECTRLTEAAARARAALEARTVGPVHMWRDEDTEFGDPDWTPVGFTTYHPERAAPLVSSPAVSPPSDDGGCAS